MPIGLNLFTPNGLFYRNSLDRSISNRRGVWLVFTNEYLFNANSVHPDQMPRSAASDLGLQCLPMSLLLDARH